MLRSCLQVALSLPLIPLILSLLGPPFHWANVLVIELLKEVGIDRNYISTAIFGIVIGDEPDEVIFVESIDRTF